MIFLVIRESERQEHDRKPDKHILKYHLQSQGLRKDMMIDPPTDIKHRKCDKHEYLNPPDPREDSDR